MSVNSCRRVDMYALVKVGSTGWVEVVFIKLSWVIASRHSVVVHRRTSAPDQPVVASHCETTVMAAVPDHSSEAHERSSEPCIVFDALLRAHLAVRTP
jgi:hypothetical protein